MCDVGPALGRAAGAGGRQLQLHTPLSLQTPPPLLSPPPAPPPPSSQRRPLLALTKQASEELWTGSSHGRSGSRGTPTPPPRRAGAAGGSPRPRPVRLAWTDRRLESPGPPLGHPAANVELVARRCPGQPRPTVRSLLPTMGDAAGPAVTRQQLAERLRRAWEDRRPNLDIFLAAIEPDNENQDDDDDAISTCTSVGEDSPGLSVVPAARSRVAPRSAAAFHVGKPAAPMTGVPPQHPQPSREGGPAVRPTECNKVPTSTPIPANPPTPAPAPQPDTRSVSVCSNPGGPAPPQCLEAPPKSPTAPSPDIRIGISLNPKVADERASDSMGPQPTPSAPPSAPQVGPQDNVPGASPQAASQGAPRGAAAVPAASAAARRMQFRNGGKTFISASCSGSGPGRPRTACPGAGAGGGTGGPMRLVRSSSSTSLSRLHQPPPVSAPPPKGILVTRGRLTRLQSAGSLDLLDVGHNSTPRDRDRASPCRIKSAPVRAKKQKASVQGSQGGQGPGPGPGARGPARSTTVAANATRTNNNSDSDDSRDGDKTGDKGKDKKNNRNSRRGISRGTSEVVTMVSLLSPGDSGEESDGDGEAMMESGTTATSAYTSPNSFPTSVSGVASFLNPDNGPSVDTSFAAEQRKIPKSVWFQPPSLPTRRPLGPGLEQPPGSPGSQASPGSLGGGGGTCSWCSVGCSSGCGGASEKRAPSTPCAPALEARTAKRRLTRTLSEPPGYGDVAVSPVLQIPLNLLLRTTGQPLTAEEKGECVQTQVVGTTTTPRAEDDDNDEEDQAAVPEFSTPKERECWELFRKMSEKGISVSYDTVLRGMLTPTEYRMRRNSLLSGC